MSEHPRKFRMIVNVDSGAFSRISGDHEGCTRHHHGELHDKLVAALDAAVDADAIASSRFSFTDGCVEEFRCTEGFNEVHSRIVHSHCVPLLTKLALVVKETTFATAVNTNRELHNKIRFRDASCSKLGTCGPALGRMQGRTLNAVGAYRNPLRNQSAKKYSAINPTAAAPIPMIHHMRSLVAFAAQFAHSNLSHLRSVVAASVASIAVARPSLAGAVREGV